MKKLCIILLVLALMTGLTLPALAAPTASHLQSQTQFQTDGSCYVALSITVRLTGDETFIEIPLPKQAKNLSVNTSAQYSHHIEEAQLLLRITVSGSGSQEFTIQYMLDDLVSKEDSGYFLTLPLLSGLHYPIEQFAFSVKLPDEVSGQPVFESGYYQQNTGGLLEYTFDGTTLSGKSKTAIKDRETLMMTLQLPENYFQKSARGFSVPDGWDLFMFCLVFLAVLYFVLTLLPKFPGRTRRFTPPEGISAGDVGTCLTGCGTDLTMLVLSWAQLGYIMIELDHKDRVTLHKRMDMGNERSSHEIRWFRSLFGQRTMIDGDSYHYAKLCRKLAGKSPLRSQLYDKRSGNPAIFRGICLLTGIIAGLQMGLDMGHSTGTKTLLGMAFAFLCGAFSYFIQSGGKCLPLRDKSPLLTALGCGTVWIALGLLAGDLQQAIPMVIFQFLAGIAASFGGKRSETGLRYMSQLWGLRRFMTGIGSFDLQQLIQQNPNYYYELAPYALALGVDRSFSRRFGKTTLPEESYLLCGAPREMTAAQFASRLRRAADVLNQRQKKLPYEQFKRK